MRLFLLQIVDANAPHDVVRIPAGGALEIDLRARLRDALMAKSVGIFRTKAQVGAALDEALIEVIDALKKDSRFALR